MSFRIVNNECSATVTKALNSTDIITAFCCVGGSSDLPSRNHSQQTCTLPRRAVTYLISKAFLVSTFAIEVFGEISKFSAQKRHILVITDITRGVFGLILCADAHSVNRIVHAHVQAQISTTLHLRSFTFDKFRGVVLGIWHPFAYDVHRVGLSIFLSRLRTQKKSTT